MQLFKTVQNRRPIETSVRHGPRISHQSQSKIENVNQVINGICWPMWLTLQNLLREKLSNDSILLAWPIRHSAWSLKFHVKNDGRTALFRVSGKAYTSQFPFGERVMYENTAVLPGNVNQRRCHGNLDWPGSNDGQVYHSYKWGSESEIVVPHDTQGEVLDQ